MSDESIKDAIAWRRKLHMNPELGFREVDTAAFVSGQLKQWGYEVHDGIGGTGVVGSLSKGPGPAIGIRADMDALPILETSGVDWTSRKPGCAHSCGHDGHIAIALAAARRLASEPFSGTLRFFFQPAEETDAGARAMILDGLFRRFPVDSIYALHNWPTLSKGMIVARDSAMMAANATFEICITGRGAHGAMPHQGADVLLAACHTVTALQSIAARSVDPIESAVVSVTQVHGGEAWNVLPELCFVRGTTRWFDPAVGETLRERIISLAMSVTCGFKCSAKVNYQPLYPVTRNSRDCAQRVRSVAASLGFHVSEEPASTCSEDFAFMLNEVPGCYFWVGSARSGDNPGLHSPRFDFNDEIMGDAVNLWVALVKTELPCKNTE